MLQMTDHEPNYGNLMSYKLYVRPAAHNKYGYSADVKTKHQKNVHHILRLLSIHGSCTTWDMARIRLHSINAIREREREYRRLFVGRYDGSRRSDGIVDLGLVVRQKKTIGKKVSWMYRLSLHGMLYCMDVLGLSNDDIDMMASKYTSVLPHIFGRWDELKSVLGDEAYKLRVLSKGLFLDGPSTPAGAGNPIRELMSFVHERYRRYFDLITENELADQISYWFYTYMIYYRHPRSGRDPARIARMKKMLKQDPDMRAWYAEFFNGARNHYRARLRAMNKASQP